MTANADQELDCLLEDQVRRDDAAKKKISELSTKGKA